MFPLVGKEHGAVMYVFLPQGYKGPIHAILRKQILSNTVYSAIARYNVPVTLCACYSSDRYLKIPCEIKITKLIV